MPIVFVHGVATRADDRGYLEGWKAVEALLRQYIAPEISDRPDAVSIRIAYWGDLAAKMSLGGIARPKGPLLGMGVEEQVAVSPVLLAEYSDVLGEVPAQRAAPGLGEGLAPMGASPEDATANLSVFSADQLSDLLVASLPGGAPLPGSQSGGGDAAAPGAAQWAIAADEVAHAADTREELASRTDLDAQLAFLFERVELAYSGEVDPLTGMGAGDGMPSRWRQRVSESVSRLGHVPGFVLSRAMAELRGPLNDAVTTFLGDVFVYLAGRGTPGAPGEIPRVVLNALRSAASDRLTPDEPMIVLTHSMGGQLVYDMVTSFLDAEPDAADLRVDFWCATASQVGLFRELGLFLAKVPPDTIAPAPSTERLGYWWNVWDYNDFLSYTAKSIVHGVDDEAYSSGLSVLTAHGGYLARPSFYRKFATKIRDAHTARLPRKE